MTVLHNKWSFHVTTMFPEMGLPSSKLFVCAKESRKDVPLKRNTKDGVQSNGQGSYIQFHARTFVKCKCITKTNVLKSWRYFSDNWGEEIRMSDSFRLHTWQLPIFLFPSLLHLLFFFFKKNLGKYIKENMKKSIDTLVSRRPYQINNE